MKCVFLLLIFLSWNIQESAARRMLRVVTIGTEPFIMKRGNEFEGYLLDLMEDLMNKANVGIDEPLGYRFHEVPDGKYGAVQDNGRWNGMMGEVIEGRADLAVADMTVTKARSEVVYFSHPFMTVVTVPLIKKPPPGAHMPFGNFNQFLSKQRSREYSVGYVQHGSTEQYFSQHRMPEVQSIYNTSKAAHTDSPYVDDYRAGANRVRSSNGRFVFFGENVALQRFVNEQPCDFMIDWQGTLGSRYYAFAFPQSEPGRRLMEKFNQLILAAQEDGTLTMLYFKWFEKRSQCIRQELCLCHDEMEHNQQHGTDDTK